MKSILILTLVCLSTFTFAANQVIVTSGFLPKEVVQQCEELGLFRPETVFKNAEIEGCNKKSEDSIECTDGHYTKSQDFLDKVSSFFKSEKKEAEKHEKMKKNCLLLGFAVVNQLVNCTKTNSQEIHCPNGVYKNSKEVADVERDNVKETETTKEIGKDSKKASKQ